MRSKTVRYDQLSLLYETFIFLFFLFLFSFLFLFLFFFSFFFRLFCPRQVLLPSTPMFHSSQSAAFRFIHANSSPFFLSIFEVFLLVWFCKSALQWPFSVMSRDAKCTRDQKLKITHKEVSKTENKHLLLGLHRDLGYWLITEHSCCLACFNNSCNTSLQKSSAHSA